MLFKLRAYLFMFLMALSMILYWPMPVLAQFVLSEVNTYRIAALWGDIILFLLRYIVGIRVNVTGAEHLPNEPCVALSKHQSALDSFVLLRVFHPQTWVFKRELFKIPFFGWATMATKPIAIDRSAGRQALKFIIESGKAKLKKGFWVLIFPEGTRTLPGQKGTYKNGGVLLAQKAGVAVVPTALNTGLFWQKGKGIINSGTVNVVVGPPISTAGKDIKTLNAEVESWIEQNTAAITLNHPHYLKMLSDEKQLSQ